MEQRICFGKNTPVTFLENLHFSRDCPYRIRQKDFQNDDIAPLHYADTLEIGLCCGIQGEVLIGNERLLIDGEAVYVVTPGAVHATAFSRGPGCIYVLQVSPEALKELVNIEALFRQNGKSIYAIPHICQGFDSVYALVQEMIRLDSHPLGRIRVLLEIFSQLESQTPAEESLKTEPLPAQNTQLCQILHWTQAHFAEEVTLGQAASVMGFSRNYFCTWFRRNTQTTYLKYLNQVRINHACRILSHSGSVDQACCESGFRDISYFIQTFRKTQGCTPKQYVRNCALPTSHRPSALQ
ncbi:MAG: AraC family transcriptional regulator [Clostridiales bacterium]|nr:AraC family transcriptional regulator [Clostridiales bacterium]